ncbi:hypothetical protein BHECKSOX2_1368 [Bathymodiolus heckerae thiotrophic gill symbiont]|nr:hypothetical protein BHECKSOX2_1368 [Bathymodiolus heckerae thiotrophic gill symbiont]
MSKIVRPLQPQQDASISFKQILTCSLRACNHDFSAMENQILGWIYLSMKRK